MNTALSFGVGLLFLANAVALGSHLPNIAIWVLVVFGLVFMLPVSFLQIEDDMRERRRR